MSGSSHFWDFGSPTIRSCDHSRSHRQLVTTTRGRSSLWSVPVSGSVEWSLTTFYFSGRVDIAVIRINVRDHNPLSIKYSLLWLCGGISTASTLISTVPIGGVKWNNKWRYGETLNMSVERKKLVWEIKEELHTLTARELFELTRHIELPGLDSSTVNKSDEESCFNYICSYMQSETLLGKEDEGLVQLLELRDVVFDLSVMSLLSVTLVG